MPETTDHPKNYTNTVLGLVVMAVLGGGGMNLVQEGNESEENEELKEQLLNADVLQNEAIEKLEDQYRDADVGQNDKYAGLLQMYNDLRLEVELIKQAHELADGK